MLTCPALRRKRDRPRRCPLPVLLPAPNYKHNLNAKSSSMSNNSTPPSSNQLYCSSMLSTPETPSRSLQALHQRPCCRTPVFIQILLSSVDLGYACMLSMTPRCPRCTYALDKHDRGTAVFRRRLLLAVEIPPTRRRLFSPSVYRSGKILVPNIGELVPDSHVQRYRQGAPHCS